MNGEQPIFTIHNSQLTIHFQIILSIFSDKRLPAFVDSLLNFWN